MTHALRAARRRLAAAATFTAGAAAGFAWPVLALAEERAHLPMQVHLRDHAFFLAGIVAAALIGAVIERTRNGGRL